MTGGEKLSTIRSDPVQSPQVYRSLVGALQYAAITRPEISYAVNQPASLDLVGFCDADWAIDPDDRRSTTELCVFLGSNLVSWSSKKQQTMSRSSYKSLASITAKITWIQSLLTEIRVQIPRQPTLLSFTLD
ncbi:uncharacterized mitochondrial protein AtMg00810-like [Humulus lupulus]|uniref:uncharacterized mitochondrial protein AtMg00810-like n=1 Tax=Humulus lupulus TaxID=3486 RepID=UPI002B40211B|nr:uncharacterized mitochondrial protein AtMg00810-like [Humulus lupulus]